MNQPLSSNEQAKVFFFCVMLILLIGAGGLGIFLILLTFWGLRLACNTNDFSHVSTVRIIHRVCAVFASVGLFLYSVVMMVDYGVLDYENDLLMLLSLIIFPVYSFLFDWLFYTPINKHKEWVVNNGIFATTVADSKKVSSLAAFSNKKSSNISIADELVKWNNLKEAGLVTEEEFAKARKDLLN